MCLLCGACFCSSNNMAVLQRASWSALTKYTTNSLVYVSTTDIYLEYIGYMFRPANRSSSGHQSNKSKVLLRYWDPNIYNYIQYKIWYWIKYIVKLKPLKHESALDIRTVLSSFSYLMDCGWTHVAYILQNKCLLCWRIPVTILYTCNRDSWTRFCCQSSDHKTRLCGMWWRAAGTTDTTVLKALITSAFMVQETPKNK
jgi:hypothetical protein